MNPVEIFCRMNQSPSIVNPSQLKALAKSFESPTGDAVVYERVPTYCLVASCAFPPARGNVTRARRNSAHVARRTGERFTPCTSTTEVMVALPRSDTVTVGTPD